MEAIAVGISVLGILVAGFAIAALRRRTEKPPSSARYVCNQCNRDDCICEVNED